MPHQYLPVILGGTLEGSGLLGDLAGVQESMGLLMRYWNVIAQDFEHETFYAGYGGGTRIRSATPQRKVTISPWFIAPYPDR